MKQWLIVAGLAVGLFAATVVGTLAIQGRLDHQGTRGIPVLAGLFPTPPVAEPLAAEPRAAEPSRSGSSVSEPGPSVGVRAMPPAAPAGETAPVSKAFDPSSLGLGLDAAELDRILNSARARERAAREREAAVAQLERETLARQRDLEDREEAIVGRMLAVERERDRLEARIAEFERDVLMIHQDDVRALRDYAQTLVALDPERAASVVAHEWAEDSGRKRVTRALALIDPIDVGAILEHLPDDRLREVMLERLKVVREPVLR